MTNCNSPYKTKGLNKIKSGCKVVKLDVNFKMILYSQQLATQHGIPLHQGHKDRKKSLRKLKKTFWLKEKNVTTFLLPEPGIAILLREFCN